MKRALFALGVFASILVLAGGQTTAQVVPPGALAPPVIVVPASAVNGAGTIPAGTGGASATVGGTLFTSTTATSTTDLLEDTLLSYSLPASTLAVNGRGVRISTQAIFAANANAKALKVYFGATLIGNSQSGNASPNGLTHAQVWTVYRTGATTQFAGGFGIFSTNNGAFASSTAPAETLSGTVLIKVTGTTPAAIGDVTAQLLLVEAI